MKCIIFINSDVEELFSFLKKIPLVGYKSRMRTRICNILEKRIKEIYQSKEEILKLCCELDENGELKGTKNEVTGQSFYKIIEEQREVLERELTILMQEKLIVEVTEDKKEAVESVRDIILNWQEPFSDNLAEKYDRWCEVFEGYDK